MASPSDQIRYQTDTMRSLVAGVKPDQWSNPTPCEEWTVRDVVNHLVGGGTMLAASFRGEKLDIDPELGMPDMLGDDPFAALDGALGAFESAVAEPGAMDRDVVLPFATLPAAVALEHRQVRHPRALLRHRVRYRSAVRSAGRRGGRGPAARGDAHQSRAAQRRDVRRRAHGTGRRDADGEAGCVLRPHRVARVPRSATGQATGRNCLTRVVTSAMLPRMAAWCYRRRRLVVVAWIVALVGVNVLAQTVGGDLLKTFSLPGTESQRTFDVLKQNFAAGDTRRARVQGEGRGRRALARGASRGRDGHRRAAASNTSRPSRRRGSRRASAQHLARRQDRVRRHPVRRAGQRRAASTSRRTCVGRASKRTRPSCKSSWAAPMFTDQTQPASELVGVARRHLHLADRVRVAARDGPADHDRAVRHRDRARGRHVARTRASTSRRSRRRSPR